MNKLAHPSHFDTSFCRLKTKQRKDSAASHGYYSDRRFRATEGLVLMDFDYDLDLFDDNGVEDDSQDASWENG